MGKIILNFMYCGLVLGIWGAYANAQGPVEDEPLLQNLCHGKQKVAKLNLYVQDVLGGPNATVWEVARANISSNSGTYFGIVRVIDNLLTAGPDRNSKKLGRAQGFIAFSDLQDVAVTMNFNFYLTGGKYRGSTLTVVGRNQLYDTNRELPVVGGTGVFRMARGYTISSTHYFNETEKYGVLLYTFYVVYFEKQPHLHLPA
ncbi:hypothetical protein Pfo_005564 [Paulownia fortunei]|nr:hypothetical protein Pfo_005564 [Paulownia fortunei]